MRVAVGEGVDWKYCEPWLDGERVTYAIEADDVAGYVVRYVTGADGHPICVPGSGLAFERLEGDVVIRQLGWTPEDEEMYDD